MPAIEQTERYHKCPKCQRMVRPDILEHVDEIPTATPPIPARLRVTCAALTDHGGKVEPCGEEWYLVADADK